MLPEIALRDVSREDVDRVAAWLDDEEVSSKWFGHYACGEPVHRGYTPEHMLEAAEWEWDHLFRRDARRHFYSIYTTGEEHIGESQVVLDGQGGAELSLLIGRKDLWHLGYGTSTMMELLDQVFGGLGLDRAWVNVPEDNAPALGLFKKLGLVHEDTRDLCRRRDGSTLKACILAMSARDFQSRRDRASRGDAVSVVTVTGLPGSDSRALGLEIAGLTGSRFVDDEIPERMCRRLRCSTGELEALEGSCRSIWGRVMRNLVTSMERYGPVDYGQGWIGPWGYDIYSEPQEYLTKDRYLEALRGVFGELTAEGPVVVHGYGSHVLIPTDARSLHIFVDAGAEFRQQTIARESGLHGNDGQRWLRRADRDAIALCRNLFGSDLLKMEMYDLILNMGRMSVQAAARTVAGALDGSSFVTPREAHPVGRGRLPVGGS